MKEVRLIRNKATGESRRFAFVEFPSTDDAKNFMKYCSGGYIELEDEYVDVSYSRDKTGGSGAARSVLAASSAAAASVNSRSNYNEERGPRFDWHCPQCGYKNFARRSQCMSCQTERPEEDVPRRFENFLCI